MGDGLGVDPLREEAEDRAEVPALAAPSSSSSLSTRSEKNKIYYFFLSDSAFTPKKATPNSAGFDIYASIPTRVPSMGKILVNTGLAVTIPRGYYGRIAPRSGLAWNYSIDVGAGVIDSDYSQEIKVLLFNFSFKDYHVSRGDRVAQLIVEKIHPDAEMEQCFYYPNDHKEPLTRRGGFGSTGK